MNDTSVAMRCGGTGTQSLRTQSLRDSEVWEFWGLGVWGSVSLGFSLGFRGLGLGFRGLGLGRRVGFRV